MKEGTWYEKYAAVWVAKYGDWLTDWLIDWLIGFNWLVPGRFEWNFQVNFHDW